MTLRHLKKYRRQLFGQCKRKYWYATRPEAQIAADQYHQHVYRCAHCGRYHLTSKPWSKNRK